jgi:hypothetical protein
MWAGVMFLLLRYEEVEVRCMCEGFGWLGDISSRRRGKAGLAGVQRATHGRVHLSTQLMHQHVLAQQRRQRQKAQHKTRPAGRHGRTGAAIGFRPSRRSIEAGRIRAVIGNDPLGQNARTPVMLLTGYYHPCS